MSNSQGVEIFIVGFMIVVVISVVAIGSMQIFDGNNLVDSFCEDHFQYGYNLYCPVDGVVKEFACDFPEKECYWVSGSNEAGREVEE